MSEIIQISQVQEESGEVLGEAQLEGLRVAATVRSLREPLVNVDPEDDSNFLDAA